ncbi:MAG: hypothetical protein J0I69_04850 [Altererythrobacter sp.]|nr:hypothetical protein [Altererythrobacter sp.]
MTIRIRPLLSRLGRSLATLAGITLASAAPAAAQTIAPSAAPVEWVRYAETATAAITQWLEAEDETAVRLRAYLDRTRPAEDRATPALQLKIWIAADGLVSRIDFPPFAHEEPNADLRALIVGRRLPATPPVDMLLPLRLAIQLDARPAPASSGQGAGHRT